MSRKLPENPNYENLENLELLTKLEADPLTDPRNQPERSESPVSNGVQSVAPKSKKQNLENADETKEEKMTRLDDLSQFEEILVKDPTATSVPIPKNTAIVTGIDFEKGNSIDTLLSAFGNTGFQATTVSDAVDRINEMIHWRMPPQMAKTEEFEHLSEQEIKDARATIFLGFTSNQISSGQREVIKYLCKHNMVDCLVTTGGGIEEDIMKCFAPHYMGDSALKGAELRKRGLNRIANLVVPNVNYCHFSDWLMPVLQEMLKEQREHNIIWTPSKLIRRMGKEINNEDSVWYWCYKNNIPVFCPGITDGAVGDILFFLSYQDDGFILDVSRDIRMINDIAMAAIVSGQIILGGSLPKHHICNANLLRNGANWSVFINSGQEFDGSDSGAKPDEAVSWGKIRLDAKPVKVYGDATVYFPLIVAGTFAHPKHSKCASKPKRPLDPTHDIPQLK